jgi:hypothetical protein
MPGLFESLSSAIGPEVVEALGKALGADASAVSRGVAAAGPLLIGGMSRMASDPAGAESLLKMLPQEGGAFGSFGSLTSLISNFFSGGSTGAGALSSLVGPGLNAIGGALSKALGFNVMPLLGIAAPAVLGVVGKAVQSEKLTAGGLAEMLKRETAQFGADPANGDAMRLVNESVAAGDQAVAAMKAYGPDWAKVAAAPVAAMMAVTSSDLSGPFDSMKEVKAAQKALLEAAIAAPAGSIASAAFGGGLTREALQSVRALAKDRNELVRLIADATAAVKQRSPAEVEAFRGAIRSIGKATAEAAKDGGLLGFGGTLVSDDEKSALEKIDAALA